MAFMRSAFHDPSAFMDAKLPIISSNAPTSV
eukprot:CAMPEP_0202719146 /NCGR_PEP_ID=MMETSP1385-20130828/128437_1 /ASSEMBLY_ACC=CAM_ASM_000861 /TAXON_ID=933848 /ORGANISM="Elphidium margaritaceum" /LENGTH=30 /DNA_ID= /DNA_START= /DNA_END= /DNA_ORIENTATION=